jgi:release factor glutamine methyltransferase
VRSIYRAAQRLRLRLWPDDQRLHIRQVDGTPIIVLPGVFDGIRLRSGAFLAQTFAALPIPANAQVLDLGTGSGIGAIFAARRAARVVATDINPEAVRCAQVNALALHLDHKIRVRAGDLFQPVRGEQFDTILFNPPFYRGQPRDMVDSAWRSPDVFDRFLRELPAYLCPGGFALIVLSTDGDVADALFSAKHLAVRPVRRRDLINEILTVYEIRVSDRAGIERGAGNKPNALQEVMARVLEGNSISSGGLP